MIPFLDLDAAYRELSPDIDAAVLRVLRSGRYIGGEEVASFEREFAAWCGAKTCVGVGNGYDALALTLRACGIGEGDEVIVPSNTFIATWLAVSAVGATPVPVEPNEATFNIEAAQIRDALTSRTRAVIPVHLYGQPVDLDPILSLARDANVRVIEDAAQAHGALYKGKRVGGHSDAVCWSFYPGKNLGALGDGGAVTTNDTDLGERIRVIGNYGSTVRYVHQVQGCNSRLDPVQAAILRVKLTHLEEWNRRRVLCANVYTEGIESHAITLPAVPSWASPVWHLYVIRCGQRDVLQAALQAAGVQTLVHYPTPPHLQGAYEGVEPPARSLARTETIAQELLSLPIGPHMSLADCERVVEAVTAAASRL